MTSERAPSNGMLLLNGLPPRTQLTLDAHSEAYLTNEQFAGIKTLPPGWHCISWSIAASASATGEDDSQANAASSIGPIEGTIRNVLLRYFEQDEVAVRELDRFQQRLVIPSIRSSSMIGSSRRSRLTRKYDPSSSQSLPTVVSTEVQNSVEPRLLPVPAELVSPWRKATSHLHRNEGKVGRTVVAKVLGVDSASGDAATDSLAAGPSRANDSKEQESLEHTGNLGRHENGKIIWGKSRQDEDSGLQEFEVETEDDGQDIQTRLDAHGAEEPKKRKRSEELSPEQASAEAEAEDEGLQFTPFDLKRSWPPPSIGAELTRWSEDKSWLLQDVARRSRFGVGKSASSDGGSDDEWFLPLLCEFELAFVIFLTANNGYAWEQWKDVLSLFCRSSSIIGAGSAFNLHPAEAGQESAQLDQPNAAVRLDGHIAFLNTLTAQLALLDSTFWSSQSNTVEEEALLKEVDVLRANIARSLSSTQPHSNDDDSSQQSLVAAWRKLSHQTSTKFGWQLDRRLDEEAEVEDDIEAEEGEDAPVVVEL